MNTNLSQYTRCLDRFFVSIPLTAGNSLFFSGSFRKQKRICIKNFSGKTVPKSATWYYCFPDESQQSGRKKVKKEEKCVYIYMKLSPTRVCLE